MTWRQRFGTRTVGAAYLVVGAGTGAGAALGGGAVAVTWAVTCGAMGVAWLAPTDAAIRPDRIRLPRRGFRPRDVLFSEIACVTKPHVWALDPHPRVELHDGRTFPLRGVTDDDLDALTEALRSGAGSVAGETPEQHLDRRAGLDGDE